MTVYENPIPCRCNRSPAVLGGLVAGLTVAILLSEDACLDRGGRVSDFAWLCEWGSGGSASIWTLLNPAVLCLVIVAVAIPVYFVVNAIGNFWIVHRGKQRG